MESTLNKIGILTFVANVDHGVFNYTKSLIDALKKVHPEGIDEGASLEVAEGLRKIIQKQLEKSQKKVETKKMKNIEFGM